MKPALPESRADNIRRLLTNFANSSSGGIEVSTESMYASAVKLYTQYCRLFGFDTFLRIRPVDFPVHFDDDCAPLPFNVTVLGLFLNWMVTDHGIQGDTACGYLAGVRKLFSNRNMSVTCFDHPSISNSRTALRLHDRSFVTKRLRLRLAFTHEMFAFLQTRVVSRNSTKGLCTIAVAEFAVILACRCSEYLYSTADHFVRGIDVLFEVRCPSTSVTCTIISSLAFFYAHWTVLSMTVSIRGAKNDKLGNGVPYSFFPAVVSETCAFCFVSDMFLWSVRARPLPRNPLFSFNSQEGNGFIFTYEDLNAALKHAASYVNRDPAFLARIGTRSLRIAGATRLAAAGKQKVDIRTHMRCKSDAFLRYIRIAASDTESARAAITNPSIIPAEDLAMHDLSTLTHRLLNVSGQFH